LDLLGCWVARETGASLRNRMFLDEGSFVRVLANAATVMRDLD
jgi:hypothetical protein